MKHQNLIAVGALTLSSMFSTNVNAQCYLMSDTLITGTETGNYTSYQRNAIWELEEVQKIDLMNPNNSTRDTAYYNLDGTIDKVESYRMVGNSLFHTITFEYNASSQVTRANESGSNGGPTWTKSFDFNYVAGVLDEILLDPFSISGSPEGMMANFENIIFTSGNISSVDLVGDMGAGVDVFELSLNYDSNPNIEDQFMPTEATDMLFRNSVNNIETVVLVNNESIGNAGDNVVEKVLTYDAFGKVLTIQNVPSAFESEDETILYVWDCTAATTDIPSINLRMYPNPVHDVLTVISDIAVDHFEIYSMIGSLVMSGSILSNGDIIVDDLDAGTYLISLYGGEFFATEKLVVR